MKILSITNQKGGVAKTTTALAMIEGLTNLGYKVLFIDLDTQRNASNSINATTTGPNILGVLLNQITIYNAIQHINGIDVIASTKAMANLEMLLAEEAGKEYKLKEVLKQLQGYDYVIIDTPPSLNLITINALVASDEIIIPSLADIYSLQGIEDLHATINTIKRYSNKNLLIAGILLTKFNARTMLSNTILEVAEKIASKMNTKLYSTKIRASVTIPEAQLTKQPILAYAPKGKPQLDYISFIKEYLQDHK